MAVLGRDDLREKLKKREIAPVYMLFGAETYLRDLAAKTIADLVLAGSSLREFNETEYSLSESKLQNALGDAEQLPMIAARRVVKITDVLVSANSNKDTIKEDDEEFLLRYLRRPAETCVVIFTANELDKRRKISKILLDNCIAVEFSPLNDAEIISWAKNKLREFDADADESALRHLFSLIGNDVRRLTNEIEKLAVAALPDRLITAALVESLVPNSREISNFDLTDYMLAGNKRFALQTLKKILDDGAEPLMLLGLIASNFHRLFLSKELMSQGVERREVARIMKLPYAKQEDFLAMARRADHIKLTYILKKLAAADLAIKTSKATPRLQIELLVCELTAV